MKMVFSFINLYPKCIGLRLLIPVPPYTVTYWLTVIIFITVFLQQLFILLTASPHEVLYLVCVLDCWLIIFVQFCYWIGPKMCVCVCVCVCVCIRAKLGRQWGWRGSYTLWWNREGRVLWWSDLFLWSLWASQVALVVKNLPASAGDVRDMGSIPGWGRSPRERNGNPLQYSCLKNPMDRGAWRAPMDYMGSQKSQTLYKRN